MSNKIKVIVEGGEEKGSNLELKLDNKKSSTRVKLDEGEVSELILFMKNTAKENIKFKVEVDAGKGLQAKIIKDTESIAPEAEIEFILEITNIGLTKGEKSNIEVTVI